jgi:hypothetical protein
MTTIAFVSGFDTKGKKDATKAFQPEAKRFIQVQRGGDLVLVDNRLPHKRRGERVLDTLLRGERKWMSVAFFCHGYSSGIQLGFDLSNVRDLARAIADTSEPDVRVLLYCCSTASTLGKLFGAAPGNGDGSFGDVLRDELCRFGAKYCRVFAHETVGHATKNPYIRFFDGDGSDVGGQGGIYPVRPGSTLWRRWKEATAYSEMRFRWPYMTVEAIHRALAGQNGVYVPEIVA